MKVSSFTRTCRRQFSCSAGWNQPKPLSSKNLKYVATDAPRQLPPNNQLVFGKTFSDHMLTIPWDVQTGWSDPTISKFTNLSISPAATVLHYGLCCFEGMKAYKDDKGNVRLFRPEMNMNRFRRSCERLALPTFDEEEMLNNIKEFVRIEKNWIPTGRGYSLYLRPTAISTQSSLGVGAAQSALAFVIASPVGPYYKNGFSAVSLYATTDHVRAWPGGAGHLKLGSNYAPCIWPQLEVNKKGYDQNLWLLGEEQKVTEVGTMNFFVLWKNEEGDLELITPPLDGTILCGVTRDTILKIAQQWNEFKVSEKTFTMPQLEKAIKEKRVFEIFGSGTAAIVSPVKTISINGKDLSIPLDPNDSTSQAGPLTKRLFNTMMDIQYGITPSEWSVVI